MEVRIDQSVVTPLSLRLGGVVRGPDDAWSRFVSIEVPFRLIPYADLIEAYWKWLDDDADDVESEPLF